jgi:hypothetical protein
VKKWQRRPTSGVLPVDHQLQPTRSPKRFPSTLEKLSNFSGSSADPGQPAGATLHRAYANRLNALRVERSRFEAARATTPATVNAFLIDFVVAAFHMNCGWPDNWR